MIATRITISSAGGVRNAYASPSRSSPSAFNGPATLRFTEYSSPVFIIISPAITGTKLTPLSRNAAFTPTVAMTKPPIAGPMSRAPLNMPEFSATAFIRSSLPTISTTNAWRVGCSKALASPSTSART